MSVFVPFCGSFYMCSLLRYVLSEIFEEKYYLSAVERKNPNLFLSKILILYS